MTIYIKAEFDIIKNKPQLIKPAGAKIPTFRQMNNRTRIRFKTNAFAKGVRKIRVNLIKVNKYGGIEKSFQIADLTVIKPLYITRKFRHDECSSRKHSVLQLSYECHLT